MGERRSRAALRREGEHACALDSVPGFLDVFYDYRGAFGTPPSQRCASEHCQPCLCAGGGRGGGRGFGGRGGFNRAPEGPPDRESGLHRCCSGAAVAAAEAAGCASLAAFASPRCIAHCPGLPYRCFARSYAAAEVVEAGEYMHPCEGEMVCKLTNSMVRRQPWPEQQRSQFFKLKCVSEVGAKHNIDSSITVVEAIDVIYLCESPD